MRASFVRYAAGIKRAIFHSPVTSSRMLSPFAMGTSAWLLASGANKLSGIAQKHGNIDLYRGLYTQGGENIMASGKRGVDANVGGTSGLVQGLHSNRRRY